MACFVTSKFCKKFINKNKDNSYFVIFGKKIVFNKKALLHYLPIVIILSLPILVLGPLLAKGYILQYDMVFGPNVNFNLHDVQAGASLYQTIPRVAILKALSLVLPMDIVQKLILYTIFSLSAYAMYKSVSVRNSGAKLVAGVFYAYNPFTYDRLMAGHWVFLLGYCITPFVVKAFYNLFTKPNRKNLLIAVLLWSLAGIISAHYILILGVLFLCFAVFFIRCKQVLYYFLVCLFGVFVVSSWWIVPTIITTNVTQSFGLEHFYTFVTKTDLKHGVWFNMISLQGYWYSGWFSLKHFVTYWPIVTVLWLIPVFIGLSSLRLCDKNKQKFVFGLLLASLIAIIFSAGPSQSVVGINSWLYMHIPGLSGLREPQKLLAILTLSYSILVAYGLDMLFYKNYRRLYYFFGLFSIITIVIMASPMFWGARGQLVLKQYPTLWANFSNYIKTNDPQAKIIILPWDIYVDSEFAGTLTTNPANQYFGRQAIFSRNTRLSGLKSTELASNKSISEAINQKDPIKLYKTMQSNNAKYILLVHSNEDTEYTWLADIKNIKVIVNDKTTSILYLTN